MFTGRLLLLTWLAWAFSYWWAIARFCILKSWKMEPRELFLSPCMLVLNQTGVMRWCVMSSLLHLDIFRTWMLLPCIGAAPSTPVPQLQPDQRGFIWPWWPLHFIWQEQNSLSPRCTQLGGEEEHLIWEGHHEIQIWHLKLSFSRKESYSLSTFDVTSDSDILTWPSDTDDVFS